MPGPQDPGTLADAFEPLPDAQPARPALEPVDDLNEIWAAARTVGANDRVDYQLQIRENAIAPVIEALNAKREARGERRVVSPETFGNLQVGVGAQILAGLTGQRSVKAERQFIWDLIAAERELDPDFLPEIPATAEEFFENARQAAIVERREAQGVLARSRGALAGATSFAGQASQVITDAPVLATMGVGWTVQGGRFALTGLAAREALIAGVTETALQPAIAQNRKYVDEELTLGQAATNIGVAATFGAAVPFALRGTGLAYDASVARLFQALPESVQTKWASRMRVDDMTIEQFMGGLSNKEAADFARDVIGEGSLTAPQRAAIAQLEGAEEIGASSPYLPGLRGDAEHGARLSEALREIMDQNRPPVASSPSVVAAVSRGSSVPPPVRPGTASTGARPLPAATFDRAAVKAAIRGPESGGNDAAVNALGSSASGRYQFIESTFVGLFRQEYGVSDAAARQAWQTRRFEPEVQERLMDRLLDQNAAALRAGGFEPSTGNLYLAHFAGSDTAVKLLRADPSTPVSSFFSRQAIAQNPTYLGGGKTVGQAIEAITSRVGGGGGQRSAVGRPGSVSDDSDIAALREEALRLGEIAIGERPLASGGSLPPMRSGRFDPSSIRVDAERFQFKSGGDEFGVSDRLRGVEEWNPVYAGRIVAWEDNAGRVFVADGHQRVGLATRISQQTGQKIELEGIVLREADGVTAADARTWAALKNIAEGTGTATDAAKVIRQVGPEVLDHLPPKSALVRDGAALSRLSDEAFGAVYNEVIPADIAAVVGHLAADAPATHSALIDLLVKLDPPNRGQAESIVRQARAAGFQSAEQIDLFGSSSVTSSLFLERAKVLERGLAGLRQLKGAFGVAAKNADALEEAGSTIARTQAQQEAARNAQAIEIVSRLAFSKDSAVADALNRAAERLANGDKLGDVVTDFIAEVRKLDLASLERAGANSGERLAPDGAGRGGDAGTQGDSAASAAEAARQPSLIEMEAATARYSDPDGAPVREQADSLFHDFKADLDPNVAARQRQELELGAAAPQRANVDQDGTPGLELFDRADQPGLDFENIALRLDEEGGEISAREILAELEADDAAIAAIKGCL